MSKRKVHGGGSNNRGKSSHIEFSWSAAAEQISSGERDRFFRFGFANDFSLWVFEVTRWLLYCFFTGDFDLLDGCSAEEFSSSLFRKPKSYRQLDATGNCWRGIPKPQSKAADDEEWPSCECEPGAGCGDECMNRNLFLECPVNPRGLFWLSCGLFSLQKKYLAFKKTLLFRSQIYQEDYLW